MIIGIQNLLYQERSKISFHYESLSELGNSFLRKISF